MAHNKTTAKFERLSQLDSSHDTAGLQEGTVISFEIGSWMMDASSNAIEH